MLFLLLAQAGEAIPGGALAGGWASFGIVGLVLGWLLLRHLPDKDRHTKDLVATFTTHTENVISKFTAELTAGRTQFASELASERGATERRYTETMAALERRHQEVLGEHRRLSELITQSADRLAAEEKDTRHALKGLDAAVTVFAATVGVGKRKRQVEEKEQGEGPVNG